MELTPYVERVRAELAVAAEAGGADARDIAERLTAPLDSAIRLTLLEALSAAAGEITQELAPGSVELRLRGLEPTFVVTPDPGAAAAPAPVMETPAIDEALAGGATTARINLRLPDDLKARVEEAAVRERLSVNTWLIRAIAAAIDTPAPPGRAGTRRAATDEGNRFTGWAR
jgi:hypothetical protein